MSSICQGYETTVCLVNHTLGAEALVVVLKLVIQECNSLVFVKSLITCLGLDDL